MTELSPSLAIPERTPLADEELMALGAACVEAAQRLDLEDVAAVHAQLLTNPNSAGKGLLVGTGEVPMTSDKVYRQVSVEAVRDLAEAGIVRNGATAQGAEHPRWGHRVFWNNGEDNKAISTGGRFILEAPKEASEGGWVKADQVTGIHTRTADGSVKNILELR